MPKKSTRARLATLRRQGAGIAREVPAAYRGNGGLFLRKMRFIDLFCGIGGFRLAFERAGGKCAFSCDWDKYSQITYEANFGEKPHGDIHKIEASEIEKHDILCAGFPCQPFSIAGVSKKLHGADTHSELE
jgi:DNA (cytosine-5)-methyltransferase 1